MRRLDFNDGWSFRHLDTDEPYEPVTLPHDAMLAEPRAQQAPSGRHAGWFEGRDYEYVKRFVPEPSWQGMALLLEFEGVYHNAEVWVNGERLVFRPYGYTNFYVDLEDKLYFDRENEIRVVARNADQPNSRWYSGAGIYRPVALWVGPAGHVEVNGVSITTVSTDPARVQVTVQATVPGEARVRLYPLDDEPDTCAAEGTVDLPACKGSVDLEVPQARLWSVDEPNRYRCRVDFLPAAAPSQQTASQSDAAEVTFGIRTLEWGEHGLLINGERVILQGACVHHTNGILGAAAYPQAEERKVSLLKRQGYNAIRSAHNPCSKSMLEACDRLGMLVVDEYADQWYIHKTAYDYASQLPHWWRADLADMVAKDRNHPSVIMYSTGNEVSETAQRRGIRLAEEMSEHLHRLDPTRPVTCGVNIFFNLLSSLGFGQYSDAKARHEIESAHKHEAHQYVPGERPKNGAVRSIVRHGAQRAGTADVQRAVGSEFFNQMAGLLGADVMKTGAALPACDAVTRDAFARMDVAGYNYGITRYRKDLQRYPQRLILGTETFCSDAYEFRELAKANPRLIGDFVWAGMDYLGEVGVGAWECDDYADLGSDFGWVSAGSGRLDLNGSPLGEALYTRVALEEESGPLIAVRPPTHVGSKHSPSAWKMSDAVPSWSWNGCDGMPAYVEVYARAATVKLWLNGKNIGTRRLHGGCVARFAWPWAPGILEAVAYDARGMEIGRHRLVSAGEDTELRLDVETGTAQQRVIFVNVRYTDSQGTIKPMARGMLRAQVSGDAQLLAFGSAAPFNRGSYLSGESETYFGQALAVVRVGGDDHPTLTVSDGTHSVMCAL